MANIYKFQVGPDPVCVQIPRQTFNAVTFIETRPGSPDGSLKIESGTAPDSLTASTTITTSGHFIHRQDLPVDSDVTKTYHQFTATDVIVDVELISFWPSVVVNFGSWSPTC